MAYIQFVIKNHTTNTLIIKNHAINTLIIEIEDKKMKCGQNILIIEY